MANLKLFLLSIFLIFTIMTSSIITEEAAVAATADSTIQEEHSSEAHEGEEGEEAHEGEEGEEAHESEEGQEGEEGEEVEEGQPRNILDESGDQDMKELGFDTKEFLTTNEMKTLFEKVFLKKDITDPEEIEFYKKMIDNIMKEIPEKVQKEEIRNYFEVDFLMKHSDTSGMEGGPEEGMEEGEEEMGQSSPKEDM